MSDAKPAAASPLDSKDFLEQLRTVHFTLLAVCLAAVVIVSSPSPTRITKATEQLSRIMAIKSGWRPNWVSASAEDMAKQHGECVSTVLSEDSQDVKLGGQTFKAVIKRRWDVHYELPEIVLTLDDNLLPSILAPDTLQKFRAFWDSSGSVLCPADHVVLHQGDRVIVWDSRELKFFQNAG